MSSMVLVSLVPLWACCGRTAEQVQLRVEPGVVRTSSEAYEFSVEVRLDELVDMWFELPGLPPQVFRRCFTAQEVGRKLPIVLRRGSYEQTAFQDLLSSSPAYAVIASQAGCTCTPEGVSS